MAYLLEGSFKSLYAGRPLPNANPGFKEKNKEGKVIVIGDADFIRNDLIPGSDQVIPLGRIKDNPIVFANKEFILNAMDYLTDGALINVKGKEIQLRPIDAFKVRREKIFWQSLNLLMPLMLILAYGTFRMIMRRRKNESYIQHD
jgi:ABC-2 type transport system permease protein